MTEKSITQELLRLENPIIAAVGLTRGLHLAVDGLDDSYDRSALNAIVDALESELDCIEETWREIHQAARDPAEVARDELILAGEPLTQVEPSA
jgi:hypothetical protein